MNETRVKPPSWRNRIVGALFVVGVISVFLAFAVREAGFRAALSREIPMLRQVDAAVRIYHADHGQYPASLAAPDFKSYITESLAVFLREGRLSYHSPAPNSPPTFILIHTTTPRGDYAIQLDGTLLYPNPK